MLLIERSPAPSMYRVTYVCWCVHSWPFAVHYSLCRALLCLRVLNSVFVSILDFNCLIFRKHVSSPPLRFRSPFLIVPPGKYLRNIVIRYMATEEQEVKEHMEAAIATVLRFSVADMTFVSQKRKGNSWGFW